MVLSWQGNGADILRFDELDSTKPLSHVGFFDRKRPQIQNRCPYIFVFLVGVFVV